MDKVLEEKTLLDIPVIGFSDVLQVNNLVFFTRDGKKFPFFKSQINGNSSFLFYFYEKNCEYYRFIKAVESLQQYGALDYDIVLKKIRFKCISLFLPELTEEILHYLVREISTVYPLSGVQINFESFDRYHDFELHLQDLFTLGYGQFTSTAVWKNGEKPDHCFLGFVICSSDPHLVEPPVYDFIELEVTDSFYLRISVSQLFESGKFDRNRIESQVLRVVEELPCTQDRKKELMELFLITKTVEVYEVDLEILDIQTWCPLWLMKTVAPLMDYFATWKLNTKVNASYKRILSVQEPRGDSTPVSQDGH